MVYANGFDCVTQCDNLICIRFENHSVLPVCLLVCLYIISAGSKSQQMSEFNIRSANALNNLRTTILGTLLISTIAIMDGNEWQFSCLTNNLLEEHSTNTADGIDNDFRIIVFSFFWFFMTIVWPININGKMKQTKWTTSN